MTSLHVSSSISSRISTTRGVSRSMDAGW
jgi:hypothetical protein